MAYTEEQVSALQSALAKGERRVTFADKTVEYRSVDELRGPPRGSKGPVHAVRRHGLVAARPSADSDQYNQGHLMGWFKAIRRRLFTTTPTYDGIGSGRRALAWSVGNPGAVAAMLSNQSELRTKSRDLVRRNAWANAALESYVANAIGTGIKPQSMLTDSTQREAVQSLWRDWTVEADAAGLTDFYGLQALACRAMLEGGEVPDPAALPPARRWH